MGLNTANYIAVMRGLTAKFDVRFKGANPFYTRVCQIAPSGGADEKYGFLGDVPGVEEWTDTRAFAELRASDYTLKNKDWVSGIRIKKNDIDDDRAGLYTSAFQSLADRAALHPDKLWIQALLAGTSSACSDGQYFFDTDHQWGDSATQSNKLTATVSSVTVTNGVSAVTAAEMKQAFNYARYTMMKYTTDKGELFHPVTIENGLGNLILFVPLELEEAAKTAFTAKLSGGGDTNIILEAPTIVPTAELTDSTSFYVFHVGDPLMPFVFQAREPLRRQSKGMEDDEVRDVKFMTTARYNVGYGAWWNAAKVTLST